MTLMKKIILIAVFSFFNHFVSAQVTATNFNVNDCSGTNHDFFTELNQGKVIVIDWVMPCSSCLLPSKTAYNVVQSYAATNPGKVHLYINDDYANTNCTSLSGWVDNNGMTNTIKFSTDAIKMSDYGADGMPKIIVVGGKNHTVYFNEINTESGNSTKLQAAINKAIEETNAISKPQAINSYIVINPNPSDNMAEITLQLNTPTTLNIELLNSIGQKLRIISSQSYFRSGEHKLEFDTQALASGFYFIKIDDGFSFKHLKVYVCH